MRALDERWPLRIECPKLQGYRPEMPDERVRLDHEHTRPLHVDREMVAT